jgi:hypothetical protein
MIDLRIPRSRLQAEDPDDPDEVVHLEVMDLVFGYVWEGEADEMSVEERLARFSHLNTCQQILMPTFSLHGEVLNGGFLQYFCNSGSLFAKEAMAGLQALGAAQHADLLQQAMAVFPSGEVPRNRRDRLLALYGNDSQRLDRELARQEKQYAMLDYFDSGDDGLPEYIERFDSMDVAYYALEKTSDSLEYQYWPTYIKAHFDDLVRAD